MDVLYKEVQGIPEFIDALRLRVEVFMIEQGFKPGWEPDEDDKVSRHFIALVDGVVVSVARFREFAPGEIKIERMATRKDFRGKGVGKEILEFMLKEIETLSPEKIFLMAQTRAQVFYEKCNFKAVSEPFDEYGVEHITMEYVG